MASPSPSRSILSRTFAKREGSGSVDTKDSKGALGLDTLCESTEPVIADLVFVHGLGGGSRSTWKSAEGSLFWPQAWLPHDEGFQGVRIHTFGYSSNWEKESILNIHDFAKALLGSIHDCPHIPRSSKKAFVLAQQFPEFSSIAERVRAIFFLATPHRGSDLAALLSRILHLAHGARPFVQDLHRNSIATQSTNDEFSHACQDLQLFSFYETLPIYCGLGKGLVVDKDSAVLGLSNERTAYMNANHREICKYSDKSDPNYQTLRNAIASYIDCLRDEQDPVGDEVELEKRNLLDDLLDITDAVEDDFHGAEARRMSGSCEWLETKKAFQYWLDESANAHIYWISAKPATGKTVLSGYVVRRLKDLGKECSFHFFDHGDKMKATTGFLLRSMAWQMAMQNTEVLAIVIEICRKNDRLAHADYRTLWRKLYVDGILKVKFNGPTYWVIDALDECKNDSELIPLLMKVCELLHVRIVVTSRMSYESYGSMIPSKSKISMDQISEDDTKMDISLYLEANLSCLPTVDQDDRQNTLTTILEKSAGCFLWVRLVLKELQQVHTAAEVFNVLEEVPSDMDSLYSRILDSMSESPYGKTLGKAILVWTVCSARPLLTEELYHALQLDIKTGIDRIEKSIAACCGELVYVDTKLRVHMVHQTARDFLLRNDIDSEFAVNKKTGHKRLTMVSLQYLYGNEMKDLRQRKLSLNNVGKTRSAFSTYACSALHQHIHQVSSSDDEVFLEIAQFLNSPNVLSWIEHLARIPDLGCIVQTGRSLRHYLRRRSRTVSPFGKDFATLDSWATDFVRLVAKFGRNLLDSPSSIYHHIPPFCPAESALKTRFAASGRGLNVLGLSTLAWDDCLATLSRPGEQLAALTCSDNYFAIGASSGCFIIYHNVTCQEIKSLNHTEPVRTLRFGLKECVIASAGMKTIQLWDVGLWHQLWRFDITADCLTLNFTDEDRLLLGALRNNQFMIWDLTTGFVSDSADWTEDEEGHQNHAYRRPIAAAIYLETSLLAVVYRGQDIVIWDIERNTLYDTYSKDRGANNNSPVVRRVKNFVTGGLAFSADPSATLLAASYSDGDLVIFDIDAGTVKETTKANAQILISSPNGRTLAAADSVGTLHLFDFETLRLLCCVRSDESSIRSLAFSADGSRILETRGSECRIWDPPALLRQDEDEENSDTISVFTTPQEIELDSSEEVVMISALTCHIDGTVIFCGRADGTICLFDTQSGLETQKLLSHAKGVPIVALMFHESSQILSSVDASSRLMSHVIVPKQGTWEASKVSVDYRIGVAVEGVLSNEQGTRVLVSSASKDVLLKISLDETPPLRSLERTEHLPHRWLNDPADPDSLLMISNNRAFIYGWDSLERRTIAEGIQIGGTMLHGHSIESITPCIQDKYLATTFKELSGFLSTSKKLVLWRRSVLTAQALKVAADPTSDIIIDAIRSLIGCLGHRLIYLHQDGWVCSMNLSRPAVEHHVRHFFIPADWMSTSTELMVDVTSKGDIVFGKKHELAIIKRGLEVNEQRPASGGKRLLETGARRPPLRMTKSQQSGEKLDLPYANGKRPSLPLL
ncbi:uncharacterized protein KY384_006690 [Bacidia gigantensis]|uniref:uncharacterized protein n=1 Tax=Bacidia gigantensis TaxID=2732470 RepID=UPI001D045DB6|nr:uncharacterized protein KY384_006690 [Bacidia gigantensis]KAG8529001.1 hypothetical protein KY384_006690 [Bacidia gigantensis]